MRDCPTPHRRQGRVPSASLRTGVVGAVRLGALTGRAASLAYGRPGGRLGARVGEQSPHAPCITLLYLSRQETWGP